MKGIRETARRGRPTVQAAIVRSLREAIISGRLKPGDRLPPRTKLVTRFGVTPVTLQRALDRLIGDGFVVPRGRAGTFVCEAPPNQSRFAIVFPGQVSDELQSGLWWHLCELSGPEAFTDGTRFSHFFAVNEHRDSPDYHRLIRDLDSHCLAGILFAWHPYQVMRSPVVTRRGVPRVALASADSPLPSIYPDLRGFVCRSLDWFRDRGRRRVGVLSLAPAGDGNYQVWVRQGVAERSLRLEPQWWQYSLPGGREARNVVHLLVSLPAEQRPDALLITDDTFIEHAAEGIAAAGLRPGRELDVVALANFPLRRPSPPGVTRIGFDMRQLMQTSLELLRRQQAGLSVPSHTPLRPMLQGETA